MDEEAVTEIAQIAAGWISRMPYYKKVDLISFVPPRLGKQFDLPQLLAGQVSDLLAKPVVAAGTWLKEKQQLKTVGFAEKWTALEEASLAVDQKIFEGQKVLLIDDLYQSGTTLNFVGSKLRLARAERVFGLSIVKGLSDTDNQ